MTRRIMGEEEDGAQTILIWRDNGPIDLLAVAPGECERWEFSDRAHVDIIFAAVTLVARRCGHNLTICIEKDVYYIGLKDAGTENESWSDFDEAGQCEVLYSNLRSWFVCKGHL